MGQDKIIKNFRELIFILTNKHKTPHKIISEAGPARRRYEGELIFSKADQ